MSWHTAGLKHGAFALQYCFLTVSVKPVTRLSKLKGVRERWRPGQRDLLSGRDGEHLFRLGQARAASEDGLSLSPGWGGPSAWGQGLVRHQTAARAVGRAEPVLEPLRNLSGSHPHPTPDRGSLSPSTPSLESLREPTRSCLFTGLSAPRGGGCHA